MTAVAVDAEGRREIVGLGLGPSEAEPFWSLSSGAAQPQGPAPARPQRRQAGHLGRPRGPRARDRKSARRRVAALPRPLDEERARPRACPRGSTAWPPPRSARRSCRPTRRARARSGGGWPTSPAPAGPSSPASWTRASTTCSPTLAGLMDESEHDVLAY